MAARYSIGGAVRRPPLEFIESLRPIGDVVMIRLGPEPVYIVNSPDLIRRILVSEAQSFGAVGLLLEKAVLATILARWRVRPVAGQTIRKLALATHVLCRLPLIVERRPAS